jgi:hypothetical protein
MPGGRGTGKVGKGAMERLLLLLLLEFGLGVEFEFEWPAEEEVCFWDCGREERPGGCAMLWL